MAGRILKLLPSLSLAALLALVAQAQTPNRIRWTPASPPAAAPAVAARAPAPAAAVRPALDALTCADPITVSPTRDYPQPGDSPLLVFRQALPVTLTPRDIDVELLALSPAGSVTYTVVPADAETGEELFGSVPFHVHTGGDPRDPALSRAIVVREIPGVAQSLALGVTTTAQLRLAVEDPGFGAVIGYASDGPITWPTMTAELSSGLPAELLGSRPVLGMRVCTATAVLQDDDLRVVQQVVQVTGPLPAGAVAHVLQEFTVPATVTAYWAEVALEWIAGPPVTATPTAVLVSLRSQDGASPPVAMPVTATAHELMIASDIADVPGARWVASKRFPLPAQLHPGRTYSLEVQMPTGTALLGVDQAGGGPLPGRLFRRSGPSEPWIQGFSDLAFRLIGIEGLGTPPAPPATALAPEIYRAVPGVPTGTVAYPFDSEARVAAVLPGPASPPLGAAVLRMAIPPFVTGTARFIAADGESPATSYTYAFAHVTGTPTRDPDQDDDGYARVLTPRPMVTHAVTATADPGGYDRMAIVLAGEPAGSTLHLLHVPRAATATAAPALLGELPGGGWAPISPEPVAPLGTLEGIVDVDGDDGSDLAVCAQLLRVTDPAPGLAAVTATANGLLLRFVPPVTATAEWLEFAVASIIAPTMTAVEVSLHDAAGLASPPEPLPPALGVVSLAPLSVTVTAQTWHGTARFPPSVTLHAGNPYWIQVSSPGEWAFGTCAVTATALPGGEYFTRAAPGAPWVRDFDRNLSFRLIGVPIGTTADVGGPAAARLALSIAPNPARGEIRLAWSGGAGRAHLEISDVAGRAVRRVRDAGPAASGAWRWDGRDDRGRAAPPGVYFARVIGEGGVVAARRVVLVQ